MKGNPNKKRWCHLSIETGAMYNNREIREGKPVLVKSFRELVPAIGKIANYNSELALFFRGQGENYVTNNGLSTFYPSIYRSNGGALKNVDLLAKFEILDGFSRKLLELLELDKRDEMRKLKKFPELQWSILQHYEVCATPLLDLTHSLRVAASFALSGTGRYGYIFVFGLPHPQGTITYSTEDELLNVRLLSASPSEALRPHFQEGYLVGTFPSLVKRKYKSLNLGVRLLAKLRVQRNGFWNRGFHQIPQKALFPDNDRIGDLCKEIGVKLGT